MKFAKAANILSAVCLAVNIVGASFSTRDWAKANHAMTELREMRDRMRLTMQELESLGRKICERESL